MRAVGGRSRPRRGRRRLARARQRRGRAAARTARPQAICTCACASRPMVLFERAGVTSTRSVSLPVPPRRARRRGRRPRARRPHAAAEGAADDAERTGVPVASGQGMSMAGKPGERSDLYATVEIQVPREVSAEESGRITRRSPKLAGTKHSAGMNRIRRAETLVRPRERHHEPEQIHREGPGSGPGRTESRREREPPAGRTGALASRAVSNSRTGSFPHSLRKLHLIPARGRTRRPAHAIGQQPKVHGGSAASALAAAEAGHRFGRVRKPNG